MPHWGNRKTDLEMTTEPTQANLTKFLNPYNLTASGQPNGHNPPSSGPYTITYNILDSENLTGSYLDTLNFDTVYVSTSDQTLYNPSVTSLFESILSSNSSTSSHSVLFQDVADLSFSNSNSLSAVISVGQAEYDSSLFGGTNTGAVTFTTGNHSDPNAQQTYGDIWVNTEHQSSDYSGINRWLIDSKDTQSNWIPIEVGTWSYKVALEEIMHALGVDVYRPSNGGNPNGLTPTSDDVLNSHKYTVTSYDPHDDMFYSSVDGKGPYPAGLQMFDILALQEIYGRNYTNRGSGNTGAAAYKLGQGLGQAASEAFVYTIWEKNRCLFSRYPRSGYSGIAE